jgi:MFS family permease
MEQAIPLQETPPTRRGMRWYDYITINIYYLGSTTVSQTNGLVFPLLVQMFVGEAVKGEVLGRLRLVTLMVALLTQALMGMLSDRSSLRWGRRRPFIFLGTLLNLLFITGIGVSSGMSGAPGLSFLFAMAIFSQVAANMAHGAQQGLIPDLVPTEKRGKFSAVKAILELPLPLILVSFTIATMISRGNMWAGILTAMTVLAASMLLAMLTPEKQLKVAPPPFDWAPILRLGLMTALFAAIILGTGALVKIIGQLLVGLPDTTLVMGMGAAGLLAMLVSVGLGVHASVRLSVGLEAARQNPSFTWWVINRLAFLVGATNLSTFAVYFIQARLGFERETAAGPAARLMLVVGVFILLSALPSGWLSDRFGRRSLVILSGLMAALGTLVALLVPNLNLIYVGGTLIGIATGCFIPQIGRWVPILSPSWKPGRYLGISNLAGAGAGAVGAYIGGPIADYFTVNIPAIEGLGYVVLFSIYGLLFLFSAVAVTRVREHTPDIPIPNPLSG